MTSRKIQPDARSPNRSILVVDDDVAATYSLSEILTGEGDTVAAEKTARKRSSSLRGAQLPKLIILEQVRTLLLYSIRMRLYRAPSPAAALPGDADVSASWRDCG